MHARSRPILLLDVDGVLLDIALYDVEWERLADAVLSPVLGTRPAGWAEPQHAAWLTAAGRARELHTRRSHPEHFWSELHAEWIAELCRRAGISAPVTRMSCAALGRAALQLYYRSTRAVVPGAREAIEALSRRYELHMASGNPAFVVETILQRIGVPELVGQPFGSDLLGVFKDDPKRFYGAILERLGADNRDVYVIDDADAALLAAREIGVKTIAIGHARDPGCHDFGARSLADVPALLGLR